MTMNLNINKRTKKKNQIGGKLCYFHEEMTDAKENFLTLEMLKE